MAFDKCIKCGWKLWNPDASEYCYEHHLDNKFDVINKAPHYTALEIEPIDYITANSMDFCEWAVIKYVSRYKLKNWLEDLKKAEYFIKRLIKNYD